MEKRIEKVIKTEAFVEPELVDMLVWRTKDLTKDQQANILAKAEIDFDMISFQIYSHLLDYLTFDQGSEILTLISRSPNFMKLEVKSMDEMPLVQDYIPDNNTLIEIVKNAVGMIQFPQNSLMQLQ